MIKSMGSKTKLARTDFYCMKKKNRLLIQNIFFVCVCVFYAQKVIKVQTALLNPRLSHFL